MRRNLMMLSVAVRSSLYKIIIILGIMAALQMGCFYHTYEKYAYPPEGSWEAQQIQTENITLGQIYGVTWTLESLIEKSKLELVFLGAFVLICLVLAWSQGERKQVKTYYFYERLPQSHEKRFAVWTIYNVCCMIILVFVQVLTVLGMGWMFKSLVPSEYESVQMFFMSFYKSEFLHCIMPLGDVIKVVRNIMMYLACSMEIAGYACMKRKPWTLFLLVALMVFGFSQEIGVFGMMDTVMILAAGISIGVNICRIRAYEPGEA